MLPTFQRCPFCFEREPTDKELDVRKQIGEACQLIGEPKVCERHPVERRHKNVPQNAHQPRTCRVLELWQRIEEVHGQKGDQHQRKHIVIDLVIGADHKT